MTFSLAKCCFSIEDSIVGSDSLFDLRGLRIYTLISFFFLEEKKFESVSMSSRRNDDTSLHTFP
jgi:hypothetical protein